MMTEKGLLVEEGELIHEAMEPPLGCMTTQSLSGAKSSFRNGYELQRTGSQKEAKAQLKQLTKQLSYDCCNTAHSSELGVGAIKL